VIDRLLFNEEVGNEAMQKKKSKTGEAARCAATLEEHFVSL
jgi:hypothetical protein